MHCQKICHLPKDAWTYDPCVPVLAFIDHGCALDSSRALKFDGNWQSGQCHVPCNLLFSKVGLCRLLGLVLERRPLHPLPPKKIDPAKVNHVKVKVKGRGFSTFYTSSATSFAFCFHLHWMPHGPPPPNLQGSIHCHLMNQHQRKPGLLGLGGGRTSRQIAGGNDHNKINTLKLVYHGKELTNGNGNNLKPWHFLLR